MGYGTGGATTAGSAPLIIVCGGRDYANVGAVTAALDYLRAKSGVRGVVHGAARGADSLAGQWARLRGIDETAFPADWSEGPSAGPKRNARMLAWLLDCPAPHGVVAFPGGRGTADMVKRARSAGVGVWEPIR